MAVRRGAAASWAGQSPLPQPGQWGGNKAPPTLDSPQPPLPAAHCPPRPAACPQNECHTDTTLQAAMELQGAPICSKSLRYVSHLAARHTAGRRAWGSMGRVGGCADAGAVAQCALGLGACQQTSAATQAVGSWPA